MADFIYLFNADTQTGQYFPDQPGVAEFWSGRGWALADPPEEKPFVSEALDIEPSTDWVTLYHPEVKAYHDFPNNRAAIEGAYEAGWSRDISDSSGDTGGVPSTETPTLDTDSESSDSETPKKVAAKRTSAKTTTKER